MFHKKVADAKLALGEDDDVRAAHGRLVSRRRAVAHVLHAQAHACDVARCMSVHDRRTRAHRAVHAHAVHS